MIDGPTNLEHESSERSREAGDTRGAARQVSAVPIPARAMIETGSVEAISEMLRARPQLADQIFRTIQETRGNAFARRVIEASQQPAPHASSGDQAAVAHQQPPAPADVEAHAAGRQHKLEDSPPQIATPNSKVWNYTPLDKARLAGDVEGAAQNGSFSSRALRMITGEGHSKTFEDMTGEDGLTFGLTDVAGDGACLAFFRSFHQAFPAAFTKAFGAEGPHLLDEQWINDNNGGTGSVGGGASKSLANNRGLVRLPWVREGLAWILAQPDFRRFQLDLFKAHKIEPMHEFFTAQHCQLEFTLAALIGIANSFGVEGAKQKFLRAKGKKDPLSSREEETTAVHNMLEDYIQTDVASDSATREPSKHLLAIGFGQDQGDLGKLHLGHHGRRVRFLFQIFPFKDAAVLTDVGDFAVPAGVASFADSNAAPSPATER